MRNTTNTLSKIDEEDSNFCDFLKFYPKNVVKATGNVDSMINFQPLSDCCYYGMFMGVINLFEAPRLPSKVTKKYCYCKMFASCLELKNAPKLQAELIEDCSYMAMFISCSNLNVISYLPITSIGKYGCAKMFSDCTNLFISKSGFEEKKFFVCPDQDSIGEQGVFSMFYNVSGEQEVTPGETYYYW